MRRIFANVEVIRFLSAREGTTAIEYAIIASGVAGAVIATVTVLGGSVLNMWTRVAAAFQ
jgi:pilus assembly protein Flp/PilA